MPGSAPLAIMTSDPIPPKASYAVLLVAADGRIVASASAASRSRGFDRRLPVTSASNSRVYFLDGDAVIRFLTPGGNIGIASQVPGSGHAEAAFSVSPDDGRIAVSLLDYSTAPTTLRIYVENLKDGGNHIELFSSTSVEEWPVGWHNGDLVLAVGAARTKTSQYCCSNPYNASSYHVVNPVTGDRRSSIGNGCTVTGPLSPAGTACYYGGPPHLQQCGSEPRTDSPTGYWQCLNSMDWDGHIMTFLKDPRRSDASLSPNGKMLAASNVPLGPLLVGLDGMQSTAPGHSGPWSGWVDDMHLIYGCDEPGCLAQILNLGSGTVSRVAGQPGSATFVGRLPGDLA